MDGRNMLREFALRLLQMDDYQREIYLVGLVYPERMESLAKLTALCAEHGIAVRKIHVVANGYQVFFEDWCGDAVLHDGSYGQSVCLWETIGFPWDEGDVSTHTVGDLVNLLEKYKNGWRKEK